MTQPDEDRTTRSGANGISWPNIPEELRERSQWVVWAGDKVPLGSTTDPQTWAPFGNVVGRLKPGQGLGFVFSPDDPYVGVDLDHCLDEEGDVCESWADTVLELLPGAYVERSPGGEGLHLIVRGALPGGLRGKRRGGVEVYAEARFFTMTGWLPAGEAPKVVGQAAPGALEQILHEFCGWKPSPEGSAGPGPQTTAFQMVADPVPPGKLLSLLQVDPKLKATVDGKRSLNGDDSATEASLASLLDGYDFSDQEIVDTCRWWRREHSSKPEKANERRLYVYLLALVRRDANEEAGQKALEELEASDLAGEPRRLAAVLALNQKLNLAPETGIEGLWEFPGDPPTYAIKAVGQDPMTLGPPKALNSCAEFFGLLHPLFGKHYEVVKGSKWASVCNALMDSRVKIVVPESRPGEEMTAYLAGYLEEFPPVGKESATDYEQAHKDGAPLIYRGMVVINARHIHECCPKHMRQTWQTPTAMGHTLAGMGLEKHEVSHVRRKRNYWKSPISSGSPVAQA